MEIDLKNLFNKFEIFLKKVEENKKYIKQTGKNDYNILSIANKNSSELMHSKILASLLNVEGLHYQDDLFLKIFLKILNINDFDSKNSKLEIEKSGRKQEDGRIDIYLTDGNTHLVIENKINASDQEKQIERYIDIIYKDFPEIESNNLYIIYLSKNRKLPSKLSLGRFKIDNNYICENSGDKIAIFKSIHYEKEILSFVDECINEVNNISNLKEALITYKQVIEKIVKKYKKKGIQMDNFLIENPTILKEAFVFNKSFSKMMGKLIYKFFKELEEYTNKEFGLEIVNNEIKNKNIIYNENKCKKWYSNDRERKNIGTFLKLNDNILLFFWLGKINFHIGITPYEEKENGKISFKNEERNKDYEKYGLRYSGKWNNEIISYSINYGNFRDNCNEILYNYITNKEKCKIKNDIKNIINKIQNQS